MITSSVQSGAYAAQVIEAELLTQPDPWHAPRGRKRLPTAPTSRHSEEPTYTNAHRCA